ncbi:anti-sigma factor [Brachybacterium sp. AOP42-C2-15]|uniref:anti-sigma factor n=1 Tax=Brachybacterium sp. AOP42-C2-15 TaxID=3457670 RepID=UPI004034EB44
MNDQQHDMTGAWALNALDAEERALLEEFLAKDPEAAAEARSFEETAGELAGSLEREAPRPELKRALMAQISQTRQLSPEPAEDVSTGDRDTGTGTATHSAVEPDTRTESASAAEHDAAEHNPTGRDAAEHNSAGHDAAVIPLDRYRSRTRWLAVAAAALMVTTIVGFGLWGTERGAQQETLEALAAMESAQAGAEQESQLVSTIMASSDAAHLTVPSQHGGSLNLMYSKDQQAMIIQSAGLPALPADEDYQLWVIESPESIHSAGTIEDPATAVMRTGEISEGASIGLTIEPAGGSDQPTMTPIAMGVL